MKRLTGRDRLIVALDVPSNREALEIVETLGETVGFYKIGWQLFMNGEWKALIEDLRGKNVFVDLKLPGDIGNTIRSAVEVCARAGVQLLTLSDSVTAATISAAVAGRGGGEFPKLLTVPLLSSMDAGDLERGPSMKEHILRRAEITLKAGCDGVIASGEAIRWTSEAFENAIIVSPGIRPAGSGSDEHKRLATPAEAIRMGADYLVVGRPIRTADDPAGVASAIVREIDDALAAPNVSHP